MQEDRREGGRQANPHRLVRLVRQPRQRVRRDRAPLLLRSPQRPPAHGRVSDKRRHQHGVRQGRGLAPDQVPHRTGQRGSRRTLRGGHRVGEDVPHASTRRRRRARALARHGVPRPETRELDGQRDETQAARAHRLRQSHALRPRRAAGEGAADGHFALPGARG